MKNCSNIILWHPKAVFTQNLVLKLNFNLVKIKELVQFTGMYVNHV